jgi:hypothetical protein
MIKMEFRKKGHIEEEGEEQNCVGSKVEIHEEEYQMIK